MHLTTPVAVIVNANAVIAHDDDDGQLKHCMQMHIHYTILATPPSTCIQQWKLHLLTIEQDFTMYHQLSFFSLQ